MDVTSEDDGHVAAIDCGGRKLITTVKVGPRPRSTAFLPDSSRAYIRVENGKVVIVADAIALKVIETIKLEGGDGCARWARSSHPTASTCT